jgi:hypothetical protein
MGFADGQDLVSRCSLGVDRDHINICELGFAFYEIVPSPGRRRLGTGTYTPSLRWRCQCISKEKEVKVKRTQMQK